MPTVNPYAQYLDALNGDVPNLTRQLTNLEQALQGNSWMQILVFSPLVCQEALNLKRHLSQIQSLQAIDLGLVNVLRLVVLSLHIAQFCRALGPNQRGIDWRLCQDVLTQVSRFLEPTSVNHPLIQSLALIDTSLERNLRELAQIMRRLVRTLSTQLKKLWHEVKRETSQAVTFLYQTRLPADLSPAQSRPAPIIRYG